MTITQKTTLDPYYTLSMRSREIIHLLCVLYDDVTGSQLGVYLTRLARRAGQKCDVISAGELMSNFEELLREDLITQEGSRYQAHPHTQACIMRLLHERGQIEHYADVLSSELQDPYALAWSYVTLTIPVLRIELLTGTHPLPSSLDDDRDAERYREALGSLNYPPYDERWRRSLSPRGRAIGLEWMQSDLTRAHPFSGRAQALLALAEEGQLTPKLTLELARLFVAESRYAELSELASRTPSPDIDLIMIWGQLLREGIKLEVIEAFKRTLKKWRAAHGERSKLPNVPEVLWLLLAYITQASAHELAEFLPPLKSLVAQEGALLLERKLLYALTLYSLGQESRFHLTSHREASPLLTLFQLTGVVRFGLRSRQIEPTHFTALPERFAELRWTSFECEAHVILSQWTELGDAERDRHKALAVALKSQGGASRETNSSAPQEAWRTALAQMHTLAQQSDHHTDSTVRPEGRSDERVAWVISLAQDEVEITPRLQLWRHGMWTKGRQLSLKRLHQERATLSFLTPQDRAVCALIFKTTEGYGWKPHESYTLKPRAALALIGHPRVYLEDEMNRRVKVGRGLARVEVRALSHGGWSLMMTPTPPRRGNIKLHVERDEVLIYELTSVQRRLLRAGESGLEVPLNGEPELRALLREISTHLEVRSALSLDADDADIVGQPYTSLTSRERAPLDIVEPDLKMHLRIKRGELDTLTLRCYVRPIPEGPELIPGEGALVITTKVSGREVSCERNLNAERTLYQRLALSLEMYAHPDELDTWHTESVTESLKLLSALREHEQDITLEWPEGEPLKLRWASSAQRIIMNVSAPSESESSWFNLTGGLEVDESQVLSLSALLRQVREGDGRFVRLNDDELLELSEAAEAQLKRLSQLLASAPERGGGVQAHAALSAALHPTITELIDASSELPQRWLRQVEEMERSQTRRRNKPRGFIAELRDYQRVGFQWLSGLMDLGFGACLADDMGLGKTIQVIALLCHRRAQGASLVLAPTSLLTHWRDEIQRFAPQMIPSILNDHVDRVEHLHTLGPRHVLITSYGLLVNEAESLSERAWNLLIFDEAQALKNHMTKRYAAARRLKARGMIALSGTPIENRLRELWSLFSILTPGLLGDQAQFRDRFEEPMGRADLEPDRASIARASLRALTQPFILRRLKDEVLTELPPKTELTIRVRLNETEASIYEAIRREALNEITEALDRAGDEARRLSHVDVLARLTRLRLASCHPRLLSVHLNRDAALKDLLSQVGVSSKHQLLQSLVDELRQSGHRALIFSQFVRQLELIRAWLDDEDIPYQYLDGSTSRGARAQRISAFQAGRGDLFLISLRAGGVGLNLTGADYVIHLDPWWNPAVEDQATDRAHRIGQDRPVTVYRLIAEGTVEERILELHERKRALADQMLTGSEAPTQLDLETLIELI